MELHQVGLEPEAGLAGAGTADHQHIFVPGGLGVFGPAVHRQPFGLREQDVVFKYGVDVAWSLVTLSLFRGCLKNKSCTNGADV